MSVYPSELLSDRIKNLMNRDYPKGKSDSYMVGWLEAWQLEAEQLIGELEVALVDCAADNRRLRGYPDEAGGVSR